MTRDQWNDAFEVVGVLSIVVTLAVVVFEIRQNTDAVRSSTIQDVSRLSYDATVLSVEDAELRAARMAVCDGTLTDDQRFQLRVYYAALLRIQMNRFYQRQLGILDDQMILALGGKGGSYRSPFFAEIWPVNKMDFTPEFQEYIEREILPLSQESC